MKRIACLLALGCATTLAYAETPEHYHYGMRLDIAAGTAVRFEPGQSREVQLVPYRGGRVVQGFNQQIMGPL